MSQRQPNLFIIGAPKCGSTSLTSMLAIHPDIFCPKEKEPNHYNDDYFSPRYKSKRAYLEIYSHAKDERYLLDGSVFYCYSENAIGRILKEKPESKFIFIIRNPYSVVVSWHAEALANGIETIPDFCEAWTAWERRRTGIALPISTVNPWQLNYYKIGALGSALKSVMDQVPKNKLFVSLLEDFSTDRKETKKLFDFLEVDMASDFKFPTLNRRTGLRSSLLVKSLSTLDRFALKLGLETNLGILRSALKSNRIILPRSEPQLDVRDCIIGQLDCEIDILSKLLDRDLSHWKSAI